MSIEDDETRSNVRAIKMCRAFTDEWPDSEWGPAHIVLSDFNLGDDSIKSSRELIDKALKNREVDFGQPWGIVDYSNHTDDELIATDEFLVKLLEIPEVERDDWVDNE